MDSGGGTQMDWIQLAWRSLGSIRFCWFEARPSDGFSSAGLRLARGWILQVAEVMAGALGAEDEDAEIHEDDRGWFLQLQVAEVMAGTLGAEPRRTRTLGSGSRSMKTKLGISDRERC